MGVLTKAIICDLDGTLALLNGRDPYNPKTVSNDLINEPVRDLVNMFHSKNYKIALLSGRFHKYHDETVKWLLKHDVRWDFLSMRDTGDNRPDTEIKKEMYYLLTDGDYDISLVLDDRNKMVKMWRDMGLTCLQVAEGDF